MVAVSQRAESVTLSLGEGPQRSSSLSRGSKVFSQRSIFFVFNLAGYTFLGTPFGGSNRSPYSIFFPNAELASSTASSAVRLYSSITGLTSTMSMEVIRPWSAMISIAR